MWQLQRSRAKHIKKLNLKRFDIRRKKKNAKKSVLQFGIGGVELDSADELSKTLTEKMKPMLCETKFLNTEKWMVINVSNNVFNDAKKSHGGELLWKTAEVIANVSHKFYTTISDIEV